MLPLMERRSKTDEVLSRYLSVERTIHEPARFGILEILALRGSTDYNSLKRNLELTDGNLHGHLKRLEEEGYIAVKKRFLSRKPNTAYRITDRGRENLKQYLNTTIDTMKKIEEELSKK